MNSHLTKRLITSIWLSLLGYLFIYNSQTFLPHAKPSLFILISIITSGFFFLFGFFREYKSLLLPAETINQFPHKCIAGIWSTILLGLFALFINGTIIAPFNSPSFATAHSVGYVISSVVIIILSFLIGWFYLYRLLLLPNIHYSKQFSTYKQRLVSAIWFGTIGVCTNYQFQKLSIMPIYIFLLASYLGFTIGYRILLLPSSIKGLLKSIMIGFTWSSYALLIVFFMFSLGSFDYLFQTQFSVANLIDSLGGIMLILLAMFPIMHLFICIPCIIFSIIFYLISRYWYK